MNTEKSTDKIAHNLPVLGVGELSAALKATVETAFHRVRVRGEISGFKHAASGHLYFSLKDADAVLDGVCWRGSAGRLGLVPEDGMEVVATGRLTTYPGRSKYQIVVESMDLAGQGALLKLLEDRRRKLAEEGLFDEQRKRDLPYLPEVIGVVTSPTGAVIRDILHRLADRFPRRVLVWPVLVQGDGAADQVAAAIDGFNRLRPDGDVPRPDLLIIARGGGSLEDLWAFNEEVVVRAVAASEIPVISAIGHETDTTLVDFVADQRAPTPTAAAEMAVPVRVELLGRVLDDAARMANAMSRRLNEARLQLDGLTRGLPNLKNILGEATQRLDDWDERLRNGLAVGLAARRRELAVAASGLRKPTEHIARGRDRLSVETRSLKRAVVEVIKDRRVGLGQAAALLESYSYERVLDRGFTMVTDGGGKAVTSSKSLSVGDGISVRFRDGVTKATVGGGLPRRQKKSTADDQGTLL